MIYQAFSLGGTHAETKVHDFPSSANAFTVAPTFFMAVQTYVDAAGPAYVRIEPDSAGDTTLTDAGVSVALCGLHCDAGDTDPPLDCGQHNNENVKYLALEGVGLLNLFSQASCNDQYQNGDEVGIDCGGSCRKKTRPSSISMSSGLMRVYSRSHLTPCRVMTFRGSTRGVRVGMHERVLGQLQ